MPTAACLRLFDIFLTILHIDETGQAESSQFPEEPSMQLAMGTPTFKEMGCIKDRSITALETGEKTYGKTASERAVSR